MTQQGETMIGAYGAWAGALAEEPPRLSLRRGWPSLDGWRGEARQALLERLLMPTLPPHPAVETISEIAYDGLDIRELRWQHPYGPPTRALYLRPSGEPKPLPGALAFHDHGGVKYFGCDKITDTGERHPLMVAHQNQYYGGVAWANELAKRGYAVLVPDAFSFASRRVRLADVPEHTRASCTDPRPDDIAGIERYHEWAASHETTMAKSLFSAGTSWPGVFLAEDIVALNILCAMPGVDSDRIGAAGLSGGGMRTDYIGGLDSRVKCAVSVGLMTTWRDYVVNKSWNHTWMIYIPGVPSLLDFPEILGLRAPLPTMVQNNRQDELFTLSEMERADAILTDVFDRAGAPDHYRGAFYDGLHKFDLEMQQDAFGWFDRWLD